MPMLRPRWRKVFRDILSQRTRTALVVLSIAVGVFAFGTIMASRIVLSDALRSSFLATNPVSATIVTEAFDDELAAAARNVPGVADAEGSRTIVARIQLGPSSWEDINLYVLPDDGDRRIGIVKPWEGAWPPPDRAVLIERSSIGRAGSAVGGTIRVAIAGEPTRELPIAGLAHDLSLPPAAIVGSVAGYVTADTAAWLGAPADFNQLKIVVSAGRDDADQIRAVADEVARVVERSGRAVLNTDVPTPLQHPAELVLPTMLAILTTLGVLALLISTFLIVNTISAILTQQTRQIGIMKAIGASAGQIAGLYFTMAGSFGLLALALAVPLAAVASFFFTRFIGGQLNIDIVGLTMPPSVILMQAAAALLVPLVAAVAPVRGVVRRPAREALAGATDAPPKASLLNRLIGRLQGLGRPTLLALRNTFRRRGRLVRTLVALSLGGAVFMSVMTLRASLYTTLDASIASQQYDVEVQLGQLYRAERVAASAAAVPGVTSVESLLRASAFPVRPDGSTGEALSLRALPPDTALFAPELSAGRWLVPGDERAVVLSNNYLAKDPAAQVGDLITLKIGDEERAWRIVGFTKELIPPVSPAWAYVPLEAFTAVAGGAGHTDTLRVATAGHDPASHAAASAALEQRLEADGFSLQQVRSRSEDRAILDDRFQLLTAVLSTMSLLIGAVGGLGLAGTMSINVLERTREIGVMRAIGASDGAVRRIVLSEGLTIAALAWLIGLLVALPMSYLMCIAFGVALLNASLVWTFSLPGVALWLLIVLALAAVASLVPARSAVRLTVREVLAYE
jgi:putative ABC transport system permease protein